jgi:Repeat of unknown function (DUF5907)
MPTLGNALDFAKYEGRNFRGHQLGTAPSTPVTGQLYYNTADNTLYWWDGSQWVSARGGASATPPATTSSLGTIQLAGDLAGTATSPQIAAGVITDAEVAAANKDGANGVYSMRRLGNSSSGPGYAMDSAARLDQMNPPVGGGSLDLNNTRLLNINDPTGAKDGANKQYVDNVAQGLDAKASVKAASTAPVTLNAPQTVDGISCVAGDRVLIKDQASPVANGIYVVAAGAWTRATDFDNWSEVPGAFVFVEQGTVNADTGWVCTSDAGGVIGTNIVSWTQFSDTGSVTGGAGLTKTGTTLDVGAGAGITVNADSVQVANDGITNAMIADGAVNLAGADVTGTLSLNKGGTGGTNASAARTSLSAAGYYSTATHGAGTTITVLASAMGVLRATKGLIVQVQDEATGAIEFPDVVVAANGDVTVTYGASVAANSKRITVLG